MAYEWRDGLAVSVTDADGVTHTLNTMSVTEHKETYNAKGQSSGFVENIF